MLFKSLQRSSNSILGINVLETNNRFIYRETKISLFLHKTFPLKTNYSQSHAPFTQLNTPYPATYIKGFLNTKNIDLFKADLGIKWFWKLFSKELGFVQVCLKLAEFQSSNNNFG
jgi:hypothetical protein